MRDDVLDSLAHQFPPLAAFTSPACGGGRRAKRVGRGKFSGISIRRSPLPNPPPQAGEGAERLARVDGRTMTTARTINFILNGQPVTADVKPHHNLVEMLQAQ